MKLYNLTDEDLTRNANAAMLSTVWGLMKEGYLTRKQYDEIVENYVVVVAKKGIFSNAFEKILQFAETKPSEYSDEFKYTLLKLVSF